VHTTSCIIINITHGSPTQFSPSLEHVVVSAPLRPGLDFTGGTQVQVERDCAPCSPITALEIRQGLSSLTLPSPEGDRPPSLGSASVQVLDGGRSLLLRLPALDADQSTALVNDLASKFGPLRSSGTSVNTIGPTLGSRLLQGSLISLLVSFVGISLYISFRYSGIFAFLALLCLAHDVLITCGLFAWLGLLQGIEVDSLFAVCKLQLMVTKSVFGCTTKRKRNHILLCNLEAGIR